MKIVFLGLGGNVGNVSDTFNAVHKMVEHSIGSIVISSSKYKTEPWGNKDQDYFLNEVIGVKTNLKPRNVLKSILDIEKELGRHRDKDNRFAPRTIDIDILFYGEQIINDEDLQIPHPRLHMRNFVLTPLAEIVPDLVHPLLKRKIIDLFESNSDTALVIKQ